MTSFFEVKIRMLSCWRRHFVSCLKEFTPKSCFFVFAYRKLTFSFSTHGSFSLRGSARCPELEIRVERGYFGGRHFETVLAARACLCDVIPSDPKLAGRTKTCNWRDTFTRSTKSIFFPSYYPVLQCYHSEFGTCLAQNNMAQEKLFGPTLGRNDTKTRPGCWVLFKMAATMFEFWASLETNLIRKICTSEAETSVSG